MELRRYGVQTTLYFPLIDKGATDFEATPVSHASGDTKVIIDGGSPTNTTNAFVHEGNGIYSLTLTASEMQGRVIVLTIIDSATKEWEDQCIVIATIAHASAEIPNMADGSIATAITKIDTIDDFVDTEVSAIKAKTDNLPSDPADQSALEAAIAAIDTTSDVAAIKAKTDNLPAAPAATGDIPTAAEIAAEVLTRDIAIEGDEDTAGVHTLTAIILKLTSRFKATTGETYKSDGSTVFMTQTPTADAGADPITELGAAS